METNTTNTAPEYFDARQLAEKLNVSLKFIHKATQSRRLPFVKIGRLNRYSRYEIEKRLLTGNLLLSKK